MKETTVKKNKKHHMGKRTGYDLINEEYHIAPLYLEQFNELNQKTEGIKAMLDIVTSHASKDLEEISKIRGKIFEGIADDIGIDLKEGWTYCNGILKRVEDGKEAKHRMVQLKI